MYKQLIIRLSQLLVALTALMVGYVLTAGLPTFITPAQAHSANAPEIPYVLYLAPEAAQRGVLNSQTASERGAIHVPSWVAARRAAQSKAIDALLIDVQLLETAKSEDIEWLKQQFQKGVVIIGLGTDDAELAAAIGLSTIRAPGEGTYTISPNQYRLVASYSIGNPEEIEALGDWVSRVLNGDESHPIIVQHPMQQMFTRSLGSLDTEDELWVLFDRIGTAVAAIYDVRQQYYSQPSGGH